MQDFIIAIIIVTCIALAIAISTIMPKIRKLYDEYKYDQWYSNAPLVDFVIIKKHIVICDYGDYPGGPTGEEWKTKAKIHKDAIDNVRPGYASDYEVKKGYGHLYEVKCLDNNESRYY